MDMNFLISVGWLQYLVHQIIVENLIIMARS